MPVLQTSRLLCRPLTENDWTFFLTLQQNPDVMRFVADARTEEEIRTAFDSRLPEWFPGSPHWLCLLLCDKTSGAPLGVTGYIQESNECAEVGFLLAPEAQGKGYGAESLHAVCEYAFASGGGGGGGYAGLRLASPQETKPHGVCWKRSGLFMKARYAQAIGYIKPGTMTGFLVC